MHRIMQLIASPFSRLEKPDFDVAKEEKFWLPLSRKLEVSCAFLEPDCPALSTVLTLLETVPGCTSHGVHEFQLIGWCGVDEPNQAILTLLPSSSGPALTTLGHANLNTRPVKEGGEMVPHSALDRMDRIKRSNLDEWHGWWWHQARFFQTVWRGNLWSDLILSP